MDLPEKIKRLADDLVDDGRQAWADRLLGAANGVFNNLEMVMKWNMNVGHIAKLDGISFRTRSDAEELLVELGKLLE